MEREDNYFPHVKLLILVFSKCIFRYAVPRKIPDLNTSNVSTFSDHRLKSCVTKTKTEVES